MTASRRTGAFKTPLFNGQNNVINLDIVQIGVGGIRLWTGGTKLRIDGTNRVDDSFIRMAFSLIDVL